jgi:hypothetical protein
MARHVAPRERRSPALLSFDVGLPGVGTDVSDSRFWLGDEPPSISYTPGPALHLCPSARRRTKRRMGKSTD